MPPTLLFFLLGAAFNLVLTPLTIQLCRRVGMLDHPGHRKIHTTPVAKLGGMALVFSLLFAVGAGLALVQVDPLLSPGRQTKITVILTFTLAAALLGFLDDLFNLRPRSKLLLQALLFGAFTVLGYRFHFLHLPGLAPADLGWVAYPLTLFWLLAVVNGFNFMDGVDGLAGTLSLVVLASIGAASLLVHGEGYVGVVWPAALGAVAAFLAFNWRPARIYLGDAGSTALGALIAFSLVALGQDAAAFQRASASHLEPFRFKLLVATLLAGYPALEVTLSFARRFTKHFIFERSMEFSEKEHLHHQLLKAGFSIPSICLMAALAQGLFATSALLGYRDQNAFAVLTILPLIIGLAYLLPSIGAFDYLGARANLQKPHFRIANHYITIQRIKLGLAQDREEVLALVSQTCWELGVRSYRVKIRPDKESQGGLDYQGQGSENPGLNGPGLWGNARRTPAAADRERDFYDFIELPGSRAEAFWIFDSHTSDDELDVEYRVLMNDFMREALLTCVALGTGRDSLDIPSVARLPHDHNSAHHLRKRDRPATDRPKDR